MVMKNTSKNLLKIAENVRKFRSEHNISQEKLAEYAGLHRTYIGQVERAEKNITIESMEKISEALKVEVIDLLS
jgi:transcriptional regulator with XRE-family HTH domain